MITVKVAKTNGRYELAMGYDEVNTAMDQWCVSIVIRDRNTNIGEEFLCMVQGSFPASECVWTQPKPDTETGASNGTTTLRLPYVSDVVTRYSGRRIASMIVRQWHVMSMLGKLVDYDELAKWNTELGL